MFQVHQKDGQDAQKGIHFQGRAYLKSAFADSSVIETSEMPSSKQKYRTSSVQELKARSVLFLFLAAMEKLSLLWEADVAIRARTRQSSRLVAWPSPEAVGVPSQKACSQNHGVLEHTAMWWVAQAEEPTAIPIDRLRHEV